MTGNEIRDCLCDLIHGSSHDGCEPSTGYLCQLKSTLEQAPRFRLNGKPIDLETAVETASRYLLDARYPLITGIGSLGIQSQQLAVEIGKKVNAVIDTGLERESGASLLSLAREGRVTATLGEIAKRVQTLVVVGCDPSRTHPRIFEQITGPDREVYLAVLDSADNPLGRVADLHVQILPAEREAGLMILESMLDGKLSNLALSCFTADQLGQLWQLTEKMVETRYVAVVGLENDSTQSGDFGSCLDSFCSWLKALNRRVKAVSLLLRTDQNGLGAENVLTWTTGFPVAVDTTRIVPVSYGMEHGSAAVLERLESDMVLLFQCSRDAFDSLGGSAKKHFFSKPAIIITSSTREDSQLEASSHSELHSNLLEIDNLICLNDDFVRLDGLPFSVSAGISGFHPGLSRFLGQVLSKCDIGRVPR